MGVMIKDGDNAPPKDIHKYLHPDEDDAYPKSKEDYPELILGKSDQHKVWLKGLHKDSIARKHINEYQATYYKAHRDSINAKRRLKRLKDKDSTI